MSVVEWHNVPPYVEDIPPDVDSDGEDRCEREEFQFESALAQFEDEPPIRYDVYPDSDDEEGNEGIANRRDSIRRGNGNLYLGQLFINGIAFKEAVVDYALRTGRNVRQYRYDKKKIAFNCEGKCCSWRIYASKPGKSTRWQVVVLKSEHTCVPNGSCEIIKVPQIARIFLDKIREEPEYYMPKKIEEMIMQTWKIFVTRNQCQHARNKSLRWIEREYAEQFARLRDYAAEIEGSNPGSSVEVDCETNEEGFHVFQRFYVCFDNIRRSWKDHYRPLIGVDGCFLKSVQKGELFVANGRDADNRIYPIVWDVVQKENTDNWSWFFKKIKHDLGLQDGDGYILISDRQKGLINAVKAELPKIEHIMCVRHIYMNLKKWHGKKHELKPLIWRLAWSYNEADYKENLWKIRLYDDSLYTDLMKTNPETWCRAFFKFGPCCEDVQNNSTESFNNSIGKARDKALVPMLETIASLAMVRIATRDYKANNHEGICTPYVSNYLAELHEDAAACIVKPSTNKQWESKLHGCVYRVNLGNMTCTCRRWEISGIPCEHAYGVMLKKGLEAQDYVSHWFRTLKWRMIYANGLVPVRGFRFWPVGDEPPIVQPTVPDMPGRKKMTKADKERKKGTNESPSKKKDKLLKRTMHCGICGTANHNSRYHSKKKSSQGALALGEPLSQVEYSQGVLTQFGN